MGFNFIKQHYLRCSFIWFLLLPMLLIGCESEQDRIAKYQATVNPENGKIVEVNGEQFRIVYIGDVRFRFPATDIFIPGSDMVYIHLLWPDIPPGKAPKTKFTKWIEENRERRNQVEVIAFSEYTENLDPYEILVQRGIRNSSKYTSRDDFELNLRIFSPKELPGFPAEAYSLTSEALTPWRHQPVVVSGGYIYFSYAAKIRVRINMMGWENRINPDWKGIYLGVIETLNKYQENN